MKIIQENRKRAQTHEGWYLRDDKESNFVTTIPSSCWVIPCLSWLSWCEANIYYIILEQKQRGRLEGGIGARWPRNGGDEDDVDEDDGCVVLTRSLFVFVFGWRSRVLCINQRRVRAATCLLLFVFFFYPSWIKKKGIFLGWITSLNWIIAIWCAGPTVNCAQQGRMHVWHAPKDKGDKF